MSGNSGVRFVAGDREAEASGLDLRGRGAHAVEHHVDLAGDQVLHRRAGAAVGHVDDAVLVSSLKSSPARWCEVPAPAEP